MMKTLLENWNKFINEGPLEDVGSYSGELSNTSSPLLKQLRKDLKLKKSSVGHTEIKKPEFVQSIKTIMYNTPDKWIFITLKHIGVINQYEDEIEKQKFEEWLKTKNYPNDAKILVIKDTPLKNDFNTPDWFIHDVIGHVAAKFFPTRNNMSKNLIYSLHAEVIPKQNSLATGDEDKLQDIMAAIIVGTLTKEMVDNILLINILTIFMLKKQKNYCLVLLKNG